MEWQKEAKSFDGIAAYAWSFNFLVRQEGSESIEGMVVTKDYFRVTGLQPLMGRTFVESENVAGPPRVIILGYQLWQRQFNGDPHIIGKTVRISRWETPPTVTESCRRMSAFFHGRRTRKNPTTMSTRS